MMIVQMSRHHLYVTTDSFSPLLTYAGITAHWVDSSFHLHDCLLGFEPLEGSHTGENLAQYVMETLNRFDLTKKLFCITADNATNNKTLSRAVARSLEEDEGIVFDAEGSLIPCLAHVINLAVQDFLQGLRVLSDDANSTDDSNADDEDEDSEGELTALADQDFAWTMTKLREICKVCYPSMIQ
jgi:hypothetical protein